MRKILMFGMLFILIIYMTGCLYEPELKPEPVLKRMVEPIENPMVPPEEMLNNVEENKTVMDSSEFTVNPTLDDSALSNSS
ncbi:MAG: hypothetical protein KAT43_05485 [Nanoarchaeota archaeon]|nr:hypothetical protein [Nanoarchaeota archaeon]